MLFVILINKLQLKQRCLVPALLGILVAGGVTTIMNKCNLDLVETILIGLAVHELYDFSFLKASLDIKFFGVLQSFLYC